MKKLLIVLFVFIVSCKSESRKKIDVFIYFDSSGEVTIDRYHIEITLNKQKLTDTIIKKHNVVGFGLIRKIAVSDSPNKLLLLKINQKALMIRLDSIQSDSIYLMATYNRGKLWPLFNDYVKQKKTVNADFFEFSKQLEKNNPEVLSGKYDSLDVRVYRKTPIDLR